MPDAGDARLSIGAFARRSRLSHKALRLYDRLGLLTPAEVNEHSGYRWYREEQLATARLVAMLRRLDMSLAQVGEVVSAPAERAAELVTDYWAATERRVASQRELADHVRLTLAGNDGLLGRYQVRLREVAAQHVLAERRPVLPAGLPAWIGAAMGRLMELGGRAGLAGPPFVIYHGEVNEDSDGPVECCVPVERLASLPPVRRVSPLG